jgi:hypothetical protein
VLTLVPRALVPGARIPGNHLVHPSGDHVDGTGGERAGAFEFVAGDQDGGSCGRGLAQGVVEFVPGGRIEASVRLVEQPQLRSTSDETGERGPSLLTGRQLAHHHVGQPSGHVEALHRREHLGRRRSDRRSPEPDVLGDGEIQVEPVLVAEQTHGPADRLSMGAEIESEHAAAAPHQRQQPGAEPQQCGLAGAVRAAQQHDLALLDPQGGAGKGGELSEHGDCVIELHDRHGRHARS